MQKGHIKTLSVGQLWWLEQLAGVVDLTVSEVRHEYGISATREALTRLMFTRPPMVRKVNRYAQDGRVCITEAGRAYLLQHGHILVEFRAERSGIRSHGLTSVAFR